MPLSLKMIEKERRKIMPKGKYYEYQIKRSALDQDYLSGNIDDFQYARESLDLDLKYEPYILAQTINSKVAKKQHEIDDAQQQLD